MTTTYTQSKELLAMGFEPSTADASLRRWYHGNSGGCSPDFGWQMQPLAWALTEKDEDTMPAWSLGQLMKFLPSECSLCYESDGFHLEDNYMKIHVSSSDAFSAIIAMFNEQRKLKDAQKKR